MPHHLDNNAKMFSNVLYRVITNDCPIVVGVGRVVGCAASLVT
jgi:hypothetical protein